MTNVTDMKYGPFAIAKRRASIRAFFKLLFMPPAKMISSKCDVLIIDTHAIELRSDYREIIQNFFYAIKDTSNCSITDNGASSWFTRLNLRLAFSLNMLFRIFLRSISRMSPVYLSELNDFYTNYYRNLIIRCGPKIVVTFCDAHPQDHLISSLAKDLHILSITLQHGLYKFDQDSPAVNNLLIENSISDYICVWGQSTAELFLAHNASGVKPIVVGSLRSEYGFNLGPRVISSSSVSPSDVQFVVNLDSDDNFLTNCMMLEVVCEVACKYDYHVYVRFHPKSKKHRYNRFKDFFGRNLSDRLDINIGCSSAVLLGPILNGSPVFIFLGSNPMPYSGYPFSFQDFSSLTSLVSDALSYGFCSKESLNYISTRLMSCEVPVKYSSLITELLEEKK